ncbi:FMN-dependent dehydrogenase-domain-containing protein [Echria macrotheca]|uniref:L-lactate dehydrogenase (cytochrome) n=1 Tax=Echria macrotheca TaxID=438768 RepID=A0AAJ0BGI4_9PEZI|nr:FMN-dependent dehydrogenase-domain-containing protein [Echria macrotheca]
MKACSSIHSKTLQSPAYQTTVAKHRSADSCWVVLYGNVYDVTDFLPHHPGGSKIILQLAGRDATDEYDPIHPPGTLEENLKPEAKLGTVDPAGIKKLKPERIEPKPTADDQKAPPPPLHTLLNLDEIEAVAKTQVSKKCWAYYFSAADDLISKYYNGSVFRSILLRPRVFVDCTTVSTATSLLGGTVRVGTPVYVCPAAMARLAHPDGEAGIARGISRFGAMQLVSNNASQTPEQIVADAAPGAVFGWQLYVQTTRAKSEAMLARINKMRDHFKCIVLTLDAPVPGKREHDEKANLESQMVVESLSNEKSTAEKRPGGGGVGQQLFFGTAADLTWETTLPWLAEHTDLPIVLKGVQTHEDAYLAAQYARKKPGSIKAIILSNHGGRALDTAPPAVHTLLEIRKYCPEVFGIIDVWIDGGIKRGTDVVKALCLGAKAVGVGRAALWGLGAGGWKGVDRTFEILQGEIETCMKLLGVKEVSELGPRFINSRMVERDIFDGGAGLDRHGLWVSRAKL